MNSLYNYWNDFEDMENYPSVSLGFLVSVFGMFFLDLKSHVCSGLFMRTERISSLRLL